MLLFIVSLFFGFWVVRAMPHHEAEVDFMPRAVEQKGAAEVNPEPSRPEPEER